MAQDRMRQIEAEMARFENEIAGVSVVRPQIPPQMPGAHLRFIPHSIIARPLPPSAYQMAQPPPSMSYPPPALPTGPVIQAAPTRYTPGSAAAATSGVSMPSKTLPQPQAADAPGPSKMVTHVLQQDVELMQMKKQQEAAYQNSYIGQVLSGKKKPKRFIRTAGGQKWEDSSLGEWDPNDYRLFCGDLGNEVSDELLAKAFRRYTSFQKAKVIRDKRTNKSRGYGFVSFKDPQDYIRAMREMNGKYVGNRPVKLKKSDWKERQLEVVKKKVKQKHKLGYKL